MIDSPSDVKSIFGHALDLPSPAERARYLDEVCQGNIALRAEVEDLIGATARAGNFLTPALPEDQPKTDRLAESVGNLIGPYKLLEQLGEGGMGLVYMAEQQRPVRRMVALKIIKPGMDSKQVIARFEAERQALAMMDHANIAKVLDAGTTDADRSYFVMELVKGVPITKCCDESRLSIKERLDLFIQVCQAIQHAHQKGIIHRDIKPTNVLVALYDGVPIPKVIDFGVAKATAQKLTEKTMFTGFGQLIGTLEYMSPEQAQFNQLDIDTRSDIYSLGVLLYELLTGSTPFEQARLRTVAFDETLRIIREEEPQKPSTRLSSADTLPTIAANRSLDPARLRTAVRGDLDWIVMKCLEKDRRRRYQTANELSSDIGRYLHDDPVHASPPSAFYRFKKLVLRNKGSLSVAAALFLAVLAAAGSFGWAIRDRAARESEIARAQLDRQAAVQRQASDSLQTARALLADGKLASAREKLAQATAQVSGIPAIHDFAAQVEAAQAELDRFQEFQNLIDRAFQAETEPRDANVVAAESPSTLVTPSTGIWERRPDAAVPFLLEALSLYAILERDDWHSTLTARFLAAQQTEQIQRGSYEALLWLADDVFRRRQDHRLARPVSRESAARQALVYLGKAESAYGPTNALYVLRARCHKAIGDDAMAAADTQLAGKTAPTIAFDHFLRGKEAFYADQLAESVSAFEAALRVEPTHYWSLMKLGYCLADLGGEPEASAAIQVFTGCILKRPEHAHAYYYRAFSYCRLPRTDEALADYSKAIELDPKHPRVWYGRGNVFYSLRKYQEALADFSKAIEIDAKLAVAWHRRGDAYSRLRKHQEALADFTKAIELDPKLVRAWLSRGLAYYELRRNKEALADFVRVIELDPRNTGVRHSRGWTYFRLSRHEEALAEFSRAIEIAPAFSRAWYSRGVVHSRLGQPEKALADYAKAIELEPRDPDATNNLAWLLLTSSDEKHRDPKRALELAAKAVQLRPKQGIFWHTLGVAHYRNGDWTAAIAALEKALELRASDGADRLFLAMSHWKLGHRDQALAEYEKALEWLQQNKQKLEKADPADRDELRRFQAEAEEIMGEAQRTNKQTDGNGGRAG